MEKSVINYDFLKKMSEYEVKITLKMRFHDKRITDIRSETIVHNSLFITEDNLVALEEWGGQFYATIKTPDDKSELIYDIMKNYYTMKDNFEGGYFLDNLIYDIRDFIETISTPYNGIRICLFTPVNVIEYDNFEDLPDELYSYLKNYMLCGILSRQIVRKYEISKNIITFNDNGLLSFRFYSFDSASIEDIEFTKAKVGMSISEFFYHIIKEIK